MYMATTTPFPMAMYAASPVGHGAFVDFCYTATGDGKLRAALVGGRQGHQRGRECLLDDQPPQRGPLDDH
jgi:hypothetical protein